MQSCCFLPSFTLRFALLREWDRQGCLLGRSPGWASWALSPWLRTVVTPGGSAREAVGLIPRRGSLCLLATAGGCAGCRGQRDAAGKVRAGAGGAGWERGLQLRCPHPGPSVPPQLPDGAPWTRQPAGAPRGGLASAGPAGGARRCGPELCRHGLASPRAGALSQTPAGLLAGTRLRAPARGVRAGGALRGAWAGAPRRSRSPRRAGPEGARLRTVSGWPARDPGPTRPPDVKPRPANPCALYLGRGPALESVACVALTSVAVSVAVS